MNSERSKSSSGVDSTFLRRLQTLKRFLVLIALLAGALLCAWSTIKSTNHPSLLDEVFGSSRIPWVMACSSLLLCVIAFIATWLRSRRFPSFPDWIHVRMLFSAIIAGAAIQIICLQPFHMTSLLLLYSWVLGVYSLLLILSPLSHSWPKLGLRSIEIIVFNLCMIAFLGEVGLRVTSRIISTPLLSRPAGNEVDNVRHFRYPQGKMRYGFPTDKLGNYDDDPSPRDPESFLAITIGDSFSAGVVPHFHHYTTVCERELGDAEVYNMGAPNLGPREYLYLLKTEALPLKPDVIVIGFFIGNDIHVPKRRLRSWFERDNILLYQVPRRLWRIFKEEQRTGHGAATLSGESARETKLTSPEDIDRVYPWVKDPMLESPVFSERAFLDIETHRAQTTCGGKIEDYEALWTVLEEMKVAAGKIPLLIMLIPDEFQLEDDLWEKVGHVPGDTTGLMMERYRPQALIKEWLDRAAIPYCDLLPVLQSMPPLEDGRPHAYHLRDTHFNTRGNEVAGIALAKALRIYWR